MKFPSIPQCFSYKIVFLSQWEQIELGSRDSYLPLIPMCNFPRLQLYMYCNWGNRHVILRIFWQKILVSWVMSLLVNPGNNVLKIEYYPDTTFLPQGINKRAPPFCNHCLYPNLLAKRCKQTHCVCSPKRAMPVRTFYC